MNVVCLVLLALWPGKRGSNRFGPDPRASIEEGAQAYDERSATARTSSEVVDLHETPDASSSVETTPETVAGPSPDAVPLLTTDSPTAMDDTSRTARPSRSFRSNAGSNTRSGARTAAKPIAKSHPNAKSGSKSALKPKAQPKPKASETAEPVEAVEVVDEAEARCERVWEAARASIVDENLSVRLQVKVRSVDKLRKLLDKGRITPEHFKRWKIRIMEL